MRVSQLCIIANRQLIINKGLGTGDWVLGNSSPVSRNEVSTSRHLEFQALINTALAYRRVLRIKN
jgi:hypothetical protein